ncbi:MAG: hypothetical protein KJ069_29935 [Anaerolineae bacterium]|nr:hypothetical protein [Anaerolineae bacterium]
MTEMTINLPHDVAARLAPIEERLPQLLRQIAQAVPADRPEASVSQPAVAYPVYNEFLNFLMTAPSPQEIIKFKASPTAQLRLRELLDKNRETVLTDAEQSELDAYEQVDYVMTMLKAKAHNQLQQTGQAGRNE